MALLDNTSAASTSEDDNDDEACPCDASISIRIPPFVGEDYFCESGVSSGSTSGFHPNDPLWDGEGCTSSSRCCSFNNPPYFVKQLPRSTSDDIEFFCKLLLNHAACSFNYFLCPGVRMECICGNT